MFRDFGTSVSRLLVVVGAVVCCCSRWSSSSIAITQVDAFSLSSSALPSSRSSWIVTPTAKKRIYSVALHNAASPNAAAGDISEQDRKQALDYIKTMNPSDLDQMIADLDKMPETELKAMGMDAEIMKTTLQMAKEDPSMLQSMTQMMETMSAEEIVERSREAQQLFSKEGLPGMVEADSADDEDEEDEDDEPVEPDPQVLDAMYAVAEIMSAGGKSKGGVTFTAFCTVPPVAVLSGRGEDDLSPQELSDCWNTGSLGATRVDRAGFERVWRAVQDNYYNDIVEEAQDRLAVSKKKKRGSDKPKVEAVTPAVVSSAATAAPTTKQPMVGANISPDQLAEQVKSIKDEDLTNMFDQMSKMSPAEEARMRTMGVDPEMMKKSAEMMKNNPLMRKAATMMIKNTSPEQLMKASQQAQERMANMSEEEKKKMLENLK